MDKKTLKEKLEFWKKQESQLVKRFDELMLLRGEAAREGDLKENAGYELRTEEAQVASAQIANARKTIKKLEEELG
ncbi:hypothetical protein A3F00_01610 [Candidatus Daviesbacteria bacterium RIFCSPHIGHO2_12_FULL_37_11]|uniref:Transcription elongation factor GreA/GreB N-terminal domain-containing protein n=1 Tax=Candidatus Daviesbacteria bacterium RIFCSPHIGHO2_12_FULL_37_11 TaxID=1797777 RepID=A0A1F5KCP6_9BACT|nr:MAG: hypothetical protein A2111_01250 [Candidatus Daviesbacteria bacterium GWA1_38_6]OGE16475.1 MAG: hypothetical protein A2769_02255 [Candidatus Daviesbacteria bacterium RIFCSPHIGHO2_01_FULL_37_27]OGE38570.1 MAG: hypothetical protein A3F00_01610 [Candidatus Daviesbacteria bacterium RIFCSPHIGHO2_12_FULL_37_11]OGE46281.1 MAG: hypothetical protein A3B39_03835 [Candidatus Daviesbacteria bacterium RIFCSPLOWO2_01_FULL_37_10]